MAVFNVKDYRNIAFIGHGGAGKTTLAELCLFKTGVTKRPGSVPDKTSCLDFTDEEKEKGCSLDSAVCSLEHAGAHLNLIDTPGSPDFCGPAIAALAGVETAVLVISAVDGIEVNTRKMMARATDFGLARMIVINKIGSEGVNLDDLVTQIQESFGQECVPVNLPAGNRSSVIGCMINKTGDSDFGDVAAAHEALLEAIVGVDDDMMEKYLGGEASDEEVLALAPQAVASGALIPIVFTDASSQIGIEGLLDAVVRLTPSPVTGKKRVLVDGENQTEITPSEDGGFIGQVFKITTDPKSHIKYCFVRCFNGKLTSSDSVRTKTDPKGSRPGHLLRMRGLEHTDLEAGVAGDIVGIAKLNAHIGDALYTAAGGEIEMPNIPTPMFSLAIESKSRGDEDKISTALRTFAEQDPCFKIEHDATTHEVVISGVGDQHVRMILGKLSSHYHLEVETHKPKIPYKETITAVTNNVEYTHKKQSGGSGQFGRVIINVLPNDRGAGYEFVDKIFGGAIDQSYRPSVDKGIRAQMVEGVLAGYPVVDVKVELIDGKTHPVDSKDIAFQIAGRGAFKQAFMSSKPVLLEPIVTIDVTAPAENVGDLQGDLASRRGRPQGQDMLPGGFAQIKAIVPLAEIADYHSRLSSITGGRGSYSIEFSHYEQVPGNVQQQIIAESKKPDAD